uniref:NADH-ubiquinone oxidoreductase chain 4 n=1 Tax=Phyllomimus detersus TaxID=948396 RepID=A0A0N9LH97_9ORTH|nr:NADH dehydrogenase subunit 4 [Phyllomimus detersus]ALG66359.1 NADH dehydrogenase subunit 4 [Phyllomimus detersus]
MLKFVGLLIFLMPLVFLEIWSWWIIQSMFFFMGSMLMLNVVFTSGFSKVSYFLGVDALSMGLILLSVWICALMIMSSSSIYLNGFHVNMFLWLVIMLMLMLLCAFISLDYFSFYLFFEGSLIPTLLLILGWGYQPERLQAGVYLMFYTLFASMPLLVGLFYIYMMWGSLYMGGIELNKVGLLLYFCLIAAFLVKMPMFLVHLWLPSAHVEAPVAGSMILAGVLLKLGGYGLLRVYFMLVKMGMVMNFFFISISLLGGVMISLLCLCQSDLKALIAYSSVAHMGLVLGGIMTMNNWGFMSSYTMMLAHGLCSSGMFCLANISYERLGSRSLLINKGLMGFMPSMSMWWFLLISSSMAAPPSLNLMGEIGLLISMIGWSWLVMFMLVFMSFFSAVYSLYLYSFSQHGKMYSGLGACSGGLVREYLVLILHWLPLNLLVLGGNLWICWL